MIGFTGDSNIRVRLPPGDSRNPIVHVRAVIRDRLGCSAEYGISSITVRPDERIIGDFTNASGDEQEQMVMSVSHQLNYMNDESVTLAISREIRGRVCSVDEIDGV